MDVFRTPDERFDGLPGYDFEPHYAEVDGLRLHYVDESPDESGGSSASPAEPPRMRPIVCFHGEPSWAYLYRKMLGPLVEGGYRVICPDLPGFGRSDKPTDRGWYSFEHHLEYASALLADLDLRDAIVVVQDWGGPIGTSWAMQNDDRVAALVVLNTGLFLGRVSKGFIAWRDFAEKNPDLPVGFVIQGGTKTELPDEVVAAYEAPFPTVESKAGAAQFPLLVPISEDEPMVAQQREMADALRRWEKPALVAFSDGDPVFPFPKAGQRYVDLIPSVDEQVRIEGAAHFLQEDRGEQIAREILRVLG
jgi:haloalkane dehalogenase